MNFNDVIADRNSMGITIELWNDGTVGISGATDAIDQIPVEEWLFFQRLLSNEQSVIKRHIKNQEIERAKLGLPSPRPVHH